MTQAEVLRAVSTLQTAIDLAIRENPVPIAIEREERVSDGAGGYRTAKRTLPPFQGRLVQPRERPSDTQEPVARRASRWLLLAPADADLQAGADPSDRFEAMGKRFVVREIRPLTFRGVVCGYEAECEEQS